MAFILNYIYFDEEQKDAILIIVINLKNNYLNRKSVDIFG
jgi:hypothetical protein